jgi:RNase P subunit RPR2
MTVCTIGCNAPMMTVRRSHGHRKIVLTGLLSDGIGAHLLRSAMRKTFYCPHCDSEPLSVIRLKESATARCLECGWHCDFMPRPIEDELGGMIASAVAAAKVGTNG